MIYYTGDPHGSKHEISRFCNRMRLTEQDTIVVLGDVGANYYGDDRDGELKRAFRRLKPTIFCIHGNHEMRPASLPAYKQKEWCGGQVWYEEEYPNLLFARDGDIFTIEGLKHLVIGGAYSVDKYYRLMRGYRWWPDEQPSEAIKAYVEEQVKKNRRVNVVLSHTCPYKYEPVEACSALRLRMLASQGSGQKKMFLAQRPRTLLPGAAVWCVQSKNRSRMEALRRGIWHPCRHLCRVC